MSMGNMMGLGTVVSSVDPDEQPVALAQALDAVLDEISDALAEGDVAEAQSLVVAAEVTSDALLEALGVPEDEASGD